MKIKNILWGAAVLMFGMWACTTPEQSDTAENEVATAVSEVENIITLNEGKYPREIDLFEDEEMIERLQFLLGDRYEEMLANFNVESPIVSEDGIYKVTGCKQHACPEYYVTILLDAIRDNMNVLINQDGKIDGFGETATIDITETLEML